MAHVPVLLEEVIEYLNLSSEKWVIDATLDGGGHSRAITERFPGIRILGIEWDPVEHAEFLKRNPDLSARITAVNDSYVNIASIAAMHGIVPDAILFDLGLSSWHYEASGRGFSFQKSEVLDMRFNPHTQTTTAADIVNTHAEEELERILACYGEEQFSKEIARAIVERRATGPIMTTDDLSAVIKSAVPGWYTHRKIHWATKTFQALRVVVNDELENVRLGVSAAIEILKPGGRLAVISFQGMEDKIVRELFKERAKAGVIRWVTRHTIKPSWDEITRNPRSRSAKMKIVEKI